MLTHIDSVQARTHTPVEGHRGVGLQNLDRRASCCQENMISRAQQSHNPQKFSFSLLTGTPHSSPRVKIPPLGLNTNPIYYNLYVYEMVIYQQGLDLSR